MHRRQSGNRSINSCVHLSNQYKTGKCQETFYFSLITISKINQRKGLRKSLSSNQNTQLRDESMDKTTPRTYGTTYIRKIATHVFKYLKTHGNICLEPIKEYMFFEPIKSHEINSFHRLYEN